MSYIRPVVMVFQEYANMSVPTQTASLPPCIVGPCKHIIDPTRQEALALVGRYTPEGFTGARIPNNRPGALIQSETVHFRLKNAEVDLTPVIPTVKSTKGNALYFDDMFYPTKATIGDRVVVYSLQVPAAPVKLPLQAVIIGKNDEEKIVLLSRSIADESISMGIKIFRKVEDFFVDTTNPGVTVDNTGETFSFIAPNYNIDDTSYQVAEAELYIGYTALRQDLDQVGIVYTPEELEGRLGTPSADNPLALGVSIAMANSTVGIMYVGVDTDDLFGYTKAKDRLENYDPVYAIVPLTTNPAILEMFKQHVEQMSTPEQGMWRIALGVTSLIKEKTISEGGQARISSDGDGDFVILTSKDASFMTDQVNSGDMLVVIGDDDQEYKYTVAAAVSEDTLTITQSTPFDRTKFQEHLYRYKYQVIKKLDRSEQAREISAVSKTFGSPRFVHVWPDLCVINGETLPGYYTACAVAGAIGGLPPHQGLTRLSIAGVENIRNSNDYFNREQLDLIAEGGTFIFMQASEISSPHIRHQLTTDRSTIEFSELSFVKNFDYVSYMAKNTLDKFLGKYNVTSSTLGLLWTALESVLENLKLYTFPRIGSPVLGYTITKINQLEGTRDRVEIFCEVDFPYPLNVIGLHIISR